MEETQSEYLKKVRRDAEAKKEYEDRCEAFAEFIIKNNCNEQEGDESDG